MKIGTRTRRVDEKLTKTCSGITNCDQNLDSDLNPKVTSKQCSVLSCQDESLLYGNRTYKYVYQEKRDITFNNSKQFCDKHQLELPVPDRQRRRNLFTNLDICKTTKKYVCEYDKRQIIGNIISNLDQKNRLFFMGLNKGSVNNENTEWRNIYTKKKIRKSFWASGHPKNHNYALFVTRQIKKKKLYDTTNGNLHPKQ